MTSRERRRVKHELKTNIDSADTFLKLAQAGTLLGVTDEGNYDSTAHSREFLTERLSELKELISSGCSSIIEEIDDTILKLK